jgi:hypothetical protein
VLHSWCHHHLPQHHLVPVLCAQLPKIQTHSESGLCGLHSSDPSKEIVKVSLFAANMSLSLKDPKISTLPQLNIINSFSNIALYKITLWKSIAFLHTKNEEVEKEYK